MERERWKFKRLISNCVRLHDGAFIIEPDEFASDERELALGVEVNTLEPSTGNICGALKVTHLRTGLLCTYATRLGYSG